VGDIDQGEGVMKRLGFSLVLLALAGAMLTSASAHTRAKQTLCHRTASTTTPYVKLSVSAKVLQGHLKHPGDIVPAPRGGCPHTLLSGSGGRAFTIALTGEAEAPAGDPVATGTAAVRLRSGQGQACYRIAVKNLPAAVAAHIHNAAAGTAGPVVVPLTTPNSAGASQGCATVARPLVAAILADPASYYVNVHTGEFPAGAVRGQLTGTSTASLGTVFALDLKGTSEPNATGTAVLRFRQDAGMACYRLHVANVTLPTVGAHIHRGAAGGNGPVVIPFNAPGAAGDASGCASADAALVNDILANPAGYYVNVHTKEHPAGAIRAQLG
jgi:CHRD domain-containing protein